MMSCDVNSDNILRIKRGPYTIRELGTALPSSVPLVLSNEVQYNIETQTVVFAPSEPSSSKLVVVPSSLNLIRSLGTKPLAVLSICGPYRSGKSYFLSRFLGMNEIFKISNTDDPCTKGIWMSTSVLECEDFIILLLDTEGMESLEASEDYIVKLLVVATTLSSMLIYNSIGIPERSDLDSLSQLSNATSSIIVNSGAESDDLYKHFPNFLWLVRDAALTYSGTPTDYLKNKVLVRSSKAKPDKMDYIVQAIISLFPSVECRMLPRPSIDPHTLANMIASESQLNPDFIQQLDEIYEYIHASIRPKVLDSDMTTTQFNGVLMAELLEQYIHAVNKDQNIVLQSCWQSAFRSVLHSYSNQLVARYKKEMKAALQSNLPIELGDPVGSNSDYSGDETLFRIHDRIMFRLFDNLDREIEALLGSNYNGDIASDVKADFQKCIAVYDVENSQFESGELLHFINENYDYSTKLCESVFNELYLPIHEQVLEAHRDKKQIDIQDMIENVKTEYFKRAIGPAKGEVLKLGLIKLQTEAEALTNIPGPPAHVKAIKITKDQIVIQWNGAAFNGRKVTKYTTEYREADSPNKEWKSADVDKCVATASDLEPFTKYYFRVYAYINEHKSHDSTISVKTKVSSAARGVAAVAAFVGGTLVSPVAAASFNPALAPAMAFVGVVGAPVFGGYMARKVYQKSGEENIPYHHPRDLTD